jgi:hypothetical protein
MHLPCSAQQAWCCTCWHGHSSGRAAAAATAIAAAAAAAQLPSLLGLGLCLGEPWRQRGRWDEPHLGQQRGHSLRGVSANSKPVPAQQHSRQAGASNTMRLVVRQRHDGSCRSPYDHCNGEGRGQRPPAAAFTQPALLLLLLLLTPKLH